jgi:transposase
MIADPMEAVKFIKNHFPDSEYYSAYEAGFSGFVLHKTLVREGINNIVVNAASVEISSRDKVKTDHRDSLKLAIQLSAGRLKGIRVPSDLNERKRELTRTRTQLMRLRIRLMNTVRMKLHCYGLLKLEHVGVLRHGIVEIIIKDQSDEIKRSVGSLCTAWKSLDQEILTLTKELKEQAKCDPYEIVYRSVPGIGFIAARILSNELGDLSQFPNERALFSFTGLTPMEFSSGDARRLGHISRQGSSLLRGVLVECAWVAIKKDPALKSTFERISIRAGKKRAIVAIARKLIGRVRSLFRNNKLYELNYSQAA